MATPQEHDKKLLEALHEADEDLYVAWKHAVVTSAVGRLINSAQEQVQQAIREMDKVTRKSNG